MWLRSALQTETTVKLIVVEKLKLFGVLWFAFAVTSNRAVVTLLPVVDVELEGGFACTTLCHATSFQRAGYGLIIPP